jgi:hypothetical protein
MDKIGRKNSDLVKCHICGKEVYARGLHRHLQLTHNIITNQPIVNTAGNYYVRSKTPKSKEEISKDAGELLILAGGIAAFFGYLMIHGETGKRYTNPAMAKMYNKRKKL